MTRGGRQGPSDGPERKCIATGATRPKAGMIRFVVGPDGTVVPDLLDRLPGRGFYVAANRAALDKAVARGLFSRAARQPVQVPPDLADLIEAGLVTRVTGLLAMARKAGAAVTGFEKTRDWLARDRAAVLIQASDGSPRERSRLRPSAGPDGWITCLTAAEMGLAFGRERAIHGALAAGGLERRVVDEAARLAGMRNMAPGQQVGDRIAGKDTKDA